MFYKKTIKNLKEKISKVEVHTTDLEEKTKQNYIKAIKRIENIEKQCEVYVTALNEQREAIGNLVKIIKYICEETKINLKKTTEKKKGK